MRYSWLLFWGICFLVSCTGGNHSCMKWDAEYIFDLDTMQSVARCYQSSFYKDVRVVLLDTMAPPLMGTVKLQECDKKLYLLDGNNGLYVFDTLGRYLCQIGGVGDGPGEYREISDFVVDPIHKCIYVLESKIQAIYIYDAVSGNFLNSMKLDDENYRSRYICYCNGCIFTDLYPKGKGNRLLRKVGMQSGEDDVLFGDREKQNLEWPHVSGYSPFYQSKHDGFYFIPLFSQYVWEWNGDNLHPFVLFKSKDWMDMETVDRALGNGFQELVAANRIYSLSLFSVNHRFMLFSYQQGNVLTYVWGNAEKKRMQKVRLLIDDVLFDRADDVCLPLRYSTTNFYGDYYYLQPWEVERWGKQMNPEKLPAALKELLENKQGSEDMNPLILYYIYK